MSKDWYAETCIPYGLRTLWYGAAMAEHKGGSLNSPPRLFVEDKSGGGLGMVSPLAEHVGGVAILNLDCH
ncbi:MAG: hypothetical protein MUO33_07660, partial [Sedimentisphaerales bacterium]|nr:hypothetical protein [Sedimentisphaerales bacterium]